MGGHTFRGRWGGEEAKLTTLAGVVAVGNATAVEKDVTDELGLGEVARNVETAQTTAFLACHVIALDDLMATTVREAHLETAPS